MYLDAKLNLIQEESAYLFFNSVNESTLGDFRRKLLNITDQGGGTTNLGTIDAFAKITQNN